MSARDAIIADALELIALNQDSIVAAIEELSRWISERGSQDTHTNVLSSLNVININADGITGAIELLRRKP